MAHKISLFQPKKYRGSYISKMQFIFLLQTFFAKMIHTATIRDYATMVYAHVSRVGMKNWIAQVCTYL